MGDRRQKILRGNVEVEAIGQYIERFMNILVNRTLLIENVEYINKTDEEEGMIRFETSPSDFKKMKDVARKTGVRLRIKGRHGLPFFLQKNRKRKMLFFGMLIFFLSLYHVSFFIWDISFEGNHRFTDDMLYGFLESVPINCGMRKKRVSCENLEAQIRNYFTEITWVSAEIRGTRLIIRIKENEALLEPVKSETTPCDLTAGRGGEIKKIVVRNGFSQVKIGDEVEVGDLLVDGTVSIYDDAEQLVNTHETHADAEIYAQTVHTIHRELSLSESLKVRTGKKRTGVYLEVMGRRFYLLTPPVENSTWEFVLEQKQLKLLENFYLPVYFGKVEAYEYVVYEKMYSKEDVASICESYILDYTEKLSEKGIQILGSDGKIEHSEFGWLIEGTITVIEDIAVEAPPDVDSDVRPEINEEN